MTKDRDREGVDLGRGGGWRRAGGGRKGGEKHWGDGRKLCFTESKHNRGGSKYERVVMEWGEGKEIEHETHH